MPRTAPHWLEMRRIGDESRFSVPSTRNSFSGSTRTLFGLRCQSLGQQTRVVRTLFELARIVQKYRLNLWLWLPIGTTHGAYVFAALRTTRPSRQMQDEQISFGNPVTNVVPRPRKECVQHVVSPGDHLSKCPVEVNFWRSQRLVSRYVQRVQPLQVF